MPIADLAAWDFVVLRGAEEEVRLGPPLLPVLAFDRDAFAFQFPWDPAFFLGRFVYGRLRPLELEAAGPDSKVSEGSKPGDGGGGK